MIELGEYEPASAIGPTRELDAEGHATGVTKLGRPTTTQEQRADAVRWMLQKINATPRESQARATILWSRQEPTVLELHGDIEHLTGKRVVFEGRVIETTRAGVPVASNPLSRSQQLIREVAEIAEQGAF